MRESTNRNTVNQLNFASIKFRKFSPFLVIIGDFPYNWFANAKSAKFSWFTVYSNIKERGLILVSYIADNLKVSVELFQDIMLQKIRDGFKIQMDTYIENERRNFGESDKCK